MKIEGICLNCFSVKGDYEVCPYCGYLEGTIPKEAYLLYPGTVLLGRYMIGTILGMGGFGATYKAWDSKLSTIVAIKEFYPGGLVNRIPGESSVMLFSGDKKDSFNEQLLRFLDEARNMAKFTGDKYIVNVFDFFEENHTAYIVMEFLDGMNLKEYMAEAGGRLAAEEALRIGEGILRAVGSIHGKGIIHRDISPDNIFILRDGRVKVLDFGAARFTANENPQLTKSIVIKMGYAPPEQYRSNMKQGPWTDIYAIGATIYKMLTGMTPEESIDRMERDHTKRPSKITEGIELWVDQLVMKAMALKPELRFKSVEQMLSVVENSGGAQFPEEELKKRKRVRAVMVLLSVIAILGMGSYIGYQGSQEPETTLATMEMMPEQITLSLAGMEERREVMEQLAGNFMEQYPEIKVTLTDKEDALLFENSESRKKGADLSLLLTSLNRSQYKFLTEYESYYPEKDKIPLGFDFLTCFVNRISFQDSETEIPKVLTDPEEAKLLREGAGQNSLYVIPASRLREIQDLWPGYYEVIPVRPEGKAAGVFAQEWSIREEATENEKIAAMLFLHFLLSESAQNTLHVQEDFYLPVNTAALSQYIEINSDYGFLANDVNTMVMKKNTDFEAYLLAE